MKCSLDAGYAHLHVASGFSYGWGTATPEEIVDEAASKEMGRIALTDSDGLYGIPRFLRACASSGIAPLVGAEITVEHKGMRGHILLIAESADGYHSLCSLITSYRFSSPERRNPVCKVETLLENSNGLICLTGAIPFGLLNRLLASGPRGEAERFSYLLTDAFGNENVYAEMTDDRTRGSRARIRRISHFAGARGLQTTASGEVAYLRPYEHRLHEALAAASELSPLPHSKHRPTDQLYLRPHEKMATLFEDYPDALAGTREIADRCAGAVKLDGELHIPSARLGKDESPRQKLLSLVLRGARERYGMVDERLKRRLRRELSCIGSLGFTGYFLLAHEAKEIARRMGTPVTGRGSAANSLVAYCLGLTQPEPFANNLLFERFIHEGRSDPPDIDMDMCSELRDPVRDELIRRYGGPEGRGVAVAATANTLSLRGAVRVACRALGYSPSETNELARHVPRRFTDREIAYHDPGGSGWEAALSEPAMKGHALQDRREYALLHEISAALGGRLWQAGTHLGGMVFGTRELKLSEMVPVEPSGTEGLPRVQYDKDDLEFCGIPKLDLLGLRMHTALRKAGELLSRRSGRKVEPLSPTFAVPNDRETYSLIRTGRNAGMFQLESPGQMHLSRRLKPRRFSDLVAQISLFRPGPVRGDLVTPYVLRRNGEEPYSVPLPELEEILKPTYGVLIFQEQVLSVASIVAGFTLAEADQIRRAMTKSRGPGAMDSLKQEFLTRARERGFPENRVGEIFDWVEGFAAYGFCAAHAASFAELSYASAYMRCHHPAEFFCGLLNSQPMGFYSPRVLLNEARRIGLGVLPPDIHLSGEGFTVEDAEDGPALRAGLIYCKGISRAAIDGILSRRVESPFVSSADLYARTPIGRNALSNLAKAGFLDCLAGRSGRRGLLGEIETLPPWSRRKDGPGQRELPHPASWWETRTLRRPAIQRLPFPPGEEERMQRSVLSLDVDGHPLLPFRKALRKIGVASSMRIPDLPDGTWIRAAGLMECLQMPPTKSGNPVYFLLIEDELGLLQCTIFGRTYERYGHLLHTKGAFLVDGRVQQDRKRGFSFLVERVSDLAEILAGEPAPGSRTAEPVAGSGGLLRARRGSRAV